MVSEKWYAWSLWLGGVRLVECRVGSAQWGLELAGAQQRNLPWRRRT